MRFVVMLCAVVLVACKQNPTAPAVNEPEVVVQLDSAPPSSFIDDWELTRWGCVRDSELMRREYTHHRGQLPPFGTGLCAVLARMGNPTRTWIYIKECDVEMYFSPETRRVQVPHVTIWIARPRVNGECAMPGQVREIIPHTFG